MTTGAATAERTMTLFGNSASSRDIAYCLHPYTNLLVNEKEGPLVIARGEGVHVFDEHGKPYIEVMAGLWSAALGFSEQRLAEAAYQQLKKLPFYHVFYQKSHDVGIDLAERLIKMAPVPMSKVFFANSGSEANDTAIKLVWYYNNAIGRPKKKKIIARVKGYHGSTIAAASLTGLPANHRDFDLPIPNILHTDCPHHYRFAEPGESEEDFATRLAQSLDELILREGPDTVAAFIAEPVMGAGGIFVPPPSYFEKIQKVLAKHDVLFIADEVICGFGRTGNAFGTQTFSLKPDMITVAKALSASYAPIAALLISEPLYRAVANNSGKIGVFGHGFTYSAHPLSAAVAIEALKIYEERDIFAHARSVGQYLQNRLREFVDHPLVGEVRGVGLLGAVELVQNKATRESFDPSRLVATYLTKRAQEHGLIMRALADTVGFAPPLVIQETDIDEICVRFGRALDETYQMVRDEGFV